MENKMVKVTVTGKDGKAQEHYFNSVVITGLRETNDVDLSKYKVDGVTPVALEVETQMAGNFGPMQTFTLMKIMDDMAEKIFEGQSLSVKAIVAKMMLENILSAGGIFKEVSSTTKNFTNMEDDGEDLLEFLKGMFEDARKGE